MTQTPLATTAPHAYRPLNTPRLHEGVVQQIVARIISGQIRPGETLPSESELAQQFNVSRTVIREAVRVLVSKGLISVRHGSGMQVQPPEEWQQLDPLILFEQLRLAHDGRVLADVLELRRVIEGEAAALAALRATPADMQMLRGFVEQMRAQLADPLAYTRLDVAFHEAILSVAHNRLLAQALRPAGQVLLVGRLISCQRPGGIDESQRGHRKIVAAIERRDQEMARAAMHHHILQFEGDIHATLARGIPQNIFELMRTFQ